MNNKEEDKIMIILKNKIHDILLDYTSEEDAWNKADEIIDSDICEKIKNDICNNYCKYPNIYHNNDDDELSKICDNCPLDKI